MVIKDPSHPTSIGESPIPSCLIDNHQRQITYLRLAITDRCNLRCRYCMPEKGISPVDMDEILTYEELERLVNLFKTLGITKVRITGGEPFARNNCFEFIQGLIERIGIEQVCITTNGVAAERYLDDLKQVGIKGINLSLDTLSRKRFKEITGRDCLTSVLSSLYKIIELGIPLKINSVVCEDTGDEELIELVKFAAPLPVSLRFIEQMPFSGRKGVVLGPASPLRDRIVHLFTDLEECQSDSISTARLYHRRGFRGTIGIIEGHSRKFCSTCNKIRVTPQGMLKTCLYDNGVLDLKHQLRRGLTDSEIITSISTCIRQRYADGRIAENETAGTNKPSMSAIGG